ncbi:hypothetical protein B0A79_22600 [Flavobacterium piscis]|uniref:Uncharacterized protein n=1 Tax=Flavobacterium piscis TaxID=1114874 RepID=A0ABX2XFJ8_9FLAO|nr:hypothetical protein [Flavobacterium piscis]OCB71187.1 hypothetical protein FLP_16885 [Flavobacterium piscis]OXE96625.1 hypothetical protein B0A79_22600 [Flavobacterium piscis]
MKKILFFYFIVFCAHSQTPLHNLLKSINGVAEINISKTNRIKFLLGKDELSEFNSNKVIELYKSSDTKAEVCMVPISISSKFHVYVEIPLFLFMEKKNLLTSNTYGSYIIFDKQTSTLYRIESDMACGSVYKKNRKILVTNSYFGALMESVFILDNNLKNIKIANGNIAN